jgi:polyhydroxyalkanoate synthesis regulator phasin
METHLFTSTILAAALSTTVLAADERTLGEKTSDTLQKAGEKTKEAGRDAVETTKEAGRAVAEGSRKAMDAIKDAVTPDADARRVEVTLAEQRIDLPEQVPAGKTAFVVRNTGSMKQNFQVEGEGIDRKFLTAVDPNESKTLHVDLKPGTYAVKNPDRASSPGKTIIVK